MQNAQKSARLKTHINGVPIDLLARCYELIENGGTLSGVAGRFSLNKERLSKAICLAKRDGLY
jgi:pimeloyl-CoA synthetase